MRGALFTPTYAGSTFTPPARGATYGVQPMRGALFTPPTRRGARGLAFYTLICPIRVCDASIADNLNIYGVSLPSGIPGYVPALFTRRVFTPYGGYAGILRQGISFSFLAAVL